MCLSLQIENYIIGLPYSDAFKFARNLWKDYSASITTWPNSPNKFPLLSLSHWKILLNTISKTTMLNKNERSEHSCLVLYLYRKKSVLTIKHYISYGVLVDVLYLLKKSPSIPSFQRAIIMNEYWIFFSNAFFIASLYMSIYFYLTYWYEGL